jgi:POT family proton-dependent oligopeptide transporter
MRAILVLFMVAPAAQGGLGFATREATSLHGTYTMVVYLLCVPGGLIADRFLGASRAVLFGGIIIACGHFSMAVHSLPSFYAGLSLIALGTGTSWRATSPGSSP